MSRKHALLLFGTSLPFYEFQGCSIQNKKNWSHFAGIFYKFFVSHCEIVFNCIALLNCFIFQITLLQYWWQDAKIRAISWSFGGLSPGPVWPHLSLSICLDNRECRECRRYGATLQKQLVIYIFILNPLTSRPGCMPGSSYTGVGVLFFVIWSWNC